MQCYEAIKGEIKDAGISYPIISGGINTYPNKHHCHQSSLRALIMCYVLYIHELLPSQAQRGDVALCHASRK